MKILQFWGSKPIENRILEIKSIFRDESRKRAMASGVSMELYEKRLAKENKILSDELEQLQIERNFIHDNRVTLSSIASIVISLIIAFGVPWYQKHQEKNDSIESLYKTIVANGDVFSANYNELKIAQNKKTPAPFLESFIEFPIENVDQKLLQKKLGIDQYRFLRYYLSLSESLNKEIELYRESTALDQSASSTDSVIAVKLMARLQSLDGEGWQESKFIYGYDTECLAYILHKTFSFIEVAERDKKATCNSDSLNRLFYHYGFIPAEVPKWLMLELIDALNKREDGMGNRLVRSYLEDGVYLR